MNPTVSVCIPTYNRKDYVRETLDSIFAQTYKDLEVVVVDDGSTDGTEEMIKRVGYPVRYYWQENRGEAAARNKLIGLAEGQFITFLDSDDLLIPNTVERMISVMEAEDEEVIVYGPYLRIDEKGNICGRCTRKLYSGYITSHLFENIFVHSCGSMFPRSVFQKVGGFDDTLPISCDYDLWLRLSLKYRFIALPEPTFKRRRHKGNLSTNSKANRLTELKVLERFYYQGGGRYVIPERLARRRLSKEAYRVGKCAIREGNYQVGCDYLVESFKMYPNIKSLAYWVRSWIAKRFRG